LEIIMKTSQWITRLAACAAVAVGAPAFADVGLMDGQDQFGSNIQSTKSRAEVRSELDAARSQGVLSHGDTDTSVMMESSPIGARGVAGSRYSERTRDEVRAELEEASRMNRDNPRDDIYRPN